MPRVLVAGCGYVGSALAAKLVGAGNEVFALSRNPVSIDGVTGVTADLTDASTLAIPDVDVAFFTAAPDASNEDAYRATYVDGSRNLKNALGAGSKLVFTSSTAVYGQDDGSEVDERSPTDPGSFRGRVLLEAEPAGEIVLRLGGIYGPGRARAIDRLRDGSARSTPGRFLNFIHRDDAVGALAHLMRLERAEGVYLGVDRQPVESEAFYRWLAEKLGVAAPPADTSRAGKNKRCSSARLVASGYAFRYPTFRDGYGELVRTRSLPPCPSSPNCVSSRAGDERHRIPWLSFDVSAQDVRVSIEEAIASLGGRVVTVDGGYGRAEFMSRVFRFVDDVEWVIDHVNARVDFRSASRVGHSDLGANRRRMRKILRRLARGGKKISVHE